MSASLVDLVHFGQLPVAGMGDAIAAAAAAGDGCRPPSAGVRSSLLVKSRPRPPLPRCHGTLRATSLVSSEVRLAFPRFKSGSALRRGNDDDGEGGRGSLITLKVKIDSLKFGSFSMERG